MKEAGSGCPVLALLLQCGARKEIKAGALAVMRKKMSSKTPFPFVPTPIRWC